MICGRAYAKVNLGLRIGSRRQDGYHPVQGIFQSIDLVDTLTLLAGEADVIATSSGKPVPRAWPTSRFEPPPLSESVPDRQRL